MEWANAQPHNTLHAWMKANPVSERRLQERLSLAIQMFSGLVELHYGGRDPKTNAAASEESLPLFVHQDLKPANMLLFGHGPGGSGPYRLALTDFGLSVCYNGADAEATCGGGTPFFMAPEQWLGLRARTPGRDIWAAGMIVAKLFAGTSTTKALQGYRHFLGSDPQRQGSREDVVRNICSHAKKNAQAVKVDGTQMPVTQLSRVQQALGPLLLECFRIGRDLGGTMLPGYARPTSLRCERTLKTIWRELRFQRWDLYHKRLPLPKNTKLEQLQHEGRHARANLYLEHMEIGTLTMMRRQCEWLRVKVDSRDRSVAEQKIQRW